jgi:3-deoxy-D-manno-octulosonate 8-phosphate phosphatase (KDO 8-P phosphatase)
MNNVPAFSGENLQRAAKIKMMIFDIDGVLTDGSLYYGAEGEAIKRFNVHDGLGIKMLPELGIATAIISARLSSITARRAQDLGVSHVFQGAQEKDLAFAQLLAQTGFTAQECGYMGDDVIDLPLLTRVGFAISVPNGRNEAKQAAHYVTQASGGDGAAREVCELILQAQGKSMLKKFQY